MIKYDSLVNKVLMNIDKITNEIMQFWGKIKEKKIDEKIYENSETISETMKITNKIFIEINTTLNFTSFEFLKIYNNFIEDIINNEEEGYELREKITRLLNEKYLNIVVTDEINLVSKALYYNLSNLNKYF